MIISRKQIISLTISFVCLIGILSVVFYIKQTSNQAVVDNYDKYIKSLPSDRRISLNKAIYNLIKTSNQINNYKNDTTIREKSYFEKFNSTTKTYSSTFIIDIPSIKQSYNVDLLWSKDSNINLTGDSLKFSCLETAKLKYGEFNCKKILGLPDISNDEILQYLPYSGYHFKITTASNLDEKLKLNIDIYIDLSDTYQTDLNTAINKYKNNAINWIKSKNLNPDNYIINYRIHGN